MPRLDLCFLGPPRMQQEGTDIMLDTRKAVALMAYLAVTGEPYSRDSLINFLWPTVGRDRGRAALRRTLSVLNKSLTGNWLNISRESVKLDKDESIRVDVDQFHAKLAECGGHDHSTSEVCPECCEPLTKAALLYRDDFLAGFTLKDSVNFDDWQFFQTEDFRLKFAGTLERLIKCHSLRQEFESAIRYARRWLELDPLHESAHCILMQLYAWAGMRTASLRQYHECVRILRNELNSFPQNSTTQLYQIIRENRLPGPTGDKPEQNIYTPLGTSLVSDDELSSSSQATMVDAAGAPERQYPAGDGSTGEPQQSTEPSLIREEHRIVTVVHVGITGSDQSDISLVSLFLRLAAEHISKYGGRIDRYLGSSVLAVFGKAQIHESDPELAIRALLEIRNDTEALGLRVAAGVNTGSVYIGCVTAAKSLEFAMMGSVINLAGRLFHEAETGELLVGESTYRLTRKAFRFSPTSIRVRGTKEAATGYRVERLLDMPKKARGIEGLRAELIGRDEELDKLKTAFERSVQGEGQMVSIIGEAGVGKSRLVDELKLFVQESGFSIIEERILEKTESEISRTCLHWLEGRCLEMGKTAGYWPLIDVLHSFFAWGAHADDKKRAESIISSLKELKSERPPAEDISDLLGPVMGNLLSIRFGNQWDAALRHVNPEQLRNKTFNALQSFFSALTKRHPVVLVFEDLHWSDSLSLDLVSLVMENLAHAPMLLLCVYRPEREQKCWHLATIASHKCPERYTEIQLRELTPKESNLLIESLLSANKLPRAVRDLILKKSQGIPFYLEEVVRALIHSGLIYLEDGKWLTKEEIKPVVVPESIQSVILSRLDHLDVNTRRVLETAAVIGYLFRRHLLESSLTQKEQLERILRELEDRDLIFEERAIPEEEYSFKHVLTQETVYQSIPQHQREALHSHVAEAIEGIYSESLVEYYEQLAYHRDNSGDTDKAGEYYFKAGEKAKRRYANIEAIAHFARGLELIQKLPQSLELTRKELELRIAYGVPLVLTRGHAAPEVRQNYTTARDLCRQVGEDPQLFHVLLGLRRFYFAYGDMKTANEFSQQLIRVAEKLNDSGYLIRAQMMAAEVLYWLGDFQRAKDHSKKGLALYDPEKHKSHVFLYGNDSEVGCRLFAGLAQWFLGYPDQALAIIREALKRSRKLAHPFNLVFAMHFSGVIHQYCGEIKAVLKLAEEEIQIARDNSFPLFASWGAVLHGWALAQLGRHAQGIKQIKQGIDAWKSTGAGSFFSYFLGLLTETYLAAGNFNEAAKTIDQSLANVRETGERVWEAELYRLKGELLLEQSQDSEKALKSFQQALEISRSQDAKSLELKTALSLSRHWKKKGRKEEARKLLNEVYSKFTEGFESPGLVQAEKLLQSLQD